MQSYKLGSGSNLLNNNEYSQQLRATVRNRVTTNSSADKQVTKNDKVISSDEVKTVASKLNDFIEPAQTSLEFKFHEELNEYYITIVNPLTNEVVKEIPPKKMLDMYASMVEFMGILVDEKI